MRMSEAHAADPTEEADMSDETGAYLEFQTVGHIVKVSAIDAATGTEVSTFGPVGSSRADLETLAIAKLEHRLKTLREAKKARENLPKGAPTRGPMRGKIV